MYDYGIYLCGTWVSGKGDAFQSVNPARPQEIVGSYTSASPGQIAELIGAAKAGQRVWRAVPPLERTATFGRYIAKLEAISEDLARSITLEQGKPIAELRGEVAKSLAEARVMAGSATHGLSEVFPSARPGIRNMTVRRPRGVIAAITPWNFPILTPMRKIAPALLFGNAIIVKPSEYTPATACLVVEAGKGIFPDGLLQLANGDGGAGRVLSAAQGIAGVTFTGSVAVGRQLQASAAENLAEVSLELGGKNAALINDVSNIDACLDQVFGAALMCSGQRCTAISRVIVERSLVEAVTEGLALRARQAIVGDGMSPGTTVGPLTNQRQVIRVSELVTAGVAEGARVVTGGCVAKPAGLGDGFFYTPTILADVTPRMRVAQEEIFGPVISLLAYDSLDTAFDILNGVDYGLTSSLFSNDNAIVQRFVDESENGMIHINHGTIPDNHMPFGGIKNSGVGAYSVGPSAASFYMTEHSVYLKYA